LFYVGFFKKNADLGTTSKSSGRPNGTKSPKRRQQSETKNLQNKQKEAPESNLRSRSPFGTSLIDLDSILASFCSLRSQFLAPRDGIDHLVIATSKVRELVFPPFEHVICSLTIRNSSPAETSSSSTSMVRELELHLSNMPSRQLEIKLNKEMV